MPMPMPLEGARIIELNRVAPGSYCTMMLGDMGAEVLRVETPPRADGSKHDAARHDDVWVLSEFTNRSKQSVTLNLKDPAAQSILHALAADADVCVGEVNGLAEAVDDPQLRHRHASVARRPRSGRYAMPVRFDRQAGRRARERRRTPHRLCPRLPAKAVSVIRAGGG